MAAEDELLGEDELLTTRQVAERLAVTPETLKGYREAGLPFLRLPGGTLRYRRADLDRWLTEQFRRPRSPERVTFERSRGA